MAPPASYSNSTSPMFFFTCPLVTFPKIYLAMFSRKKEFLVLVKSPPYDVIGHMTQILKFLKMVQTYTNDISLESG